MPRVKRGTTHVKKRRNLLKQAKGYRWGRSSKTRLAKIAVLKAGKYAFRDRRNKKRTNRRLQQIRINAGVRPLGMNYSTFIGLIHKAGIKLDRKVLSQLAADYNGVFVKVVDAVKK